MAAALAAVEVNERDTDFDALAMKRHLSAAEAALLADRHIETIRDALRSGDLHGSQRVKGGTWRVKPSCLIAWNEGEKCEHRTAAKPVELNAWRTKKEARA